MIFPIFFGGFEVYYRIVRVYTTNRLPFIETWKMHRKTFTKPSQYGLATPNLKFSSNILQRKHRLDGSRNMLV